MSLPHTIPSKIDHTISDLYGDNAAMDAWRCSCVHAAEALGAQHAGERLTKALALAKDGAVELASAGSALVTNGSERYKVKDGTCACPDYANRGVPCKHVLAVAIHRQALQPAAPAPAAAWQTTEAPASCNIKVRANHGVRS